MSLSDYRVAMDVGRDGTMLGLEVMDPTATAPIMLEVVLPGAYRVRLLLEYSEAGNLFDLLAGAMREVVGGMAQSKLRASDTPTERVR